MNAQQLCLARFGGGDTGLVTDLGSGPVLAPAAAVQPIIAAGDGVELRRFVDSILARTWSTALQDANVDELRSQWSTFVAGGAGTFGGWVPVDSVTLEAPLPSPSSRVFALGGNFPAHMVRFMAAMGSTVSAESLWDEKDRGLPPWGYTVVPGLATGHRHPVTPPRGVTLLDYEGEFALALASCGRDLEPDDVRFVGVTVYSDFSIRDTPFGVGAPIDRGPLHWSLGKNFESGKVLGPWLSVLEPDPDELAIICRVNGETRQAGTGAEMLYSAAETVAFLSRYIELAPGDIITSGCPDGAAAEQGGQSELYLKAGDVVEVEVSGVGVLQNAVSAW